MEEQDQTQRLLNRWLRRALTELIERLCELRDAIPTDPEPEERER